MSATSPLETAAHGTEEIFRRAKVAFTLGGEPTFVPNNPDGPEWNFNATGGDKLGFAWKLAARILDKAMPGALPFFCPGKRYPGEVNPRWSILLAERASGRDFPARPAADFTMKALRRRLPRALGVKGHWQHFRDPNGAEVSALLLDHEDGVWRSHAWKLPPAQRNLLAAEGPAGLRLPLQLAPQGVPRRALVLERKKIVFRFFSRRSSWRDSSSCWMRLPRTAG